MKIAYLSTFYPYRGGIAQFNESLFKELGKNHEVKAFTFKRQYPDILFPGKTQFVERKNVIDTIQAKRLLDSTNPFSYLTTAKVINDFHPDILLLKYWLPYLALPLGFVTKCLKKHTKVISIIDNLYSHEKNFLDLPLTQFFLSQNHGFIVMNEFVKKELITLKPKANVLTLEHPLYNHFGEKPDKDAAKYFLKINPNKKTILFFGLIREYKGLDLLINAFGILSNEYQLIIAGESYEDFSKYQQMIDHLPNKENIFIHNHFIPDEQVPYFFSAADVLVLPYRSITQSGIARLAFNYDLPLITTNVGGLKETNYHNRTGIVLKEISSNLIAGSIIYYFENHLQDLFIPEIRKLKAELTWNNFANGITRLYETLAM